jgi:hypothetical protein
MGARPKIRPGLEAIDIILETFAAGIALAVLVYSAVNWSKLSAAVPASFGLDGRPDAGSANVTLLSIVIASAVCYALMTVMALFPWTFNYPVEVREDNASRLYAIGTRLLRLIKALVTLFLAWLLFASPSLARSSELGNGTTYYSVPIFLAALLGAVAWGFRAMRKGRDSRA